MSFVAFNLSLRGRYNNEQEPSSNISSSTNVFCRSITGKILAKSPYADSQKTRYDYAVEDLTSKKIINGFPDGNFHPYENVTRAQFAKMIVIAIDKENEKTAYAMCISGSMLPEDIKQQTDGAVLNDNSNFGATPNSDSNA